MKIVHGKPLLSCLTLPLNTIEKFLNLALLIASQWSSSIYTAVVGRSELRLCLPANWRLFSLVSPRGFPSEYMIDRKGGVFPLAYLTMIFYSGYDQGVFSGIVGNDDFLEIVHHPSAGILGIIVSIYNLGCFTGTIVSFVTGDRLGPRKSMWFAMVWIIVSPRRKCHSESRNHLIPISPRSM